MEPQRGLFSEFKQPGFDGSRIQSNLWSAACLTLPEPPNPIPWLLLSSADQNPTQPFLSSGQSSFSSFPRAFQISPFGMGSAPSGVSWPCFCMFQTTERSVLGTPVMFCVPHLHASHMAEFPSFSKPSPLVQHRDLHSRCWRNRCEVRRMSRGSERGFGRRIGALTPEGTEWPWWWPAGREGTRDKLCLVHCGRKAGPGYTHIFINKTLSFVVNQRVEGTTGAKDE